MSAKFEIPLGQWGEFHVEYADCGSHQMRIVATEAFLPPMEQLWGAIEGMVEVYNDLREDVEYDTFRPHGSRTRCVFPERIILPTPEAESE